MSQAFELITPSSRLHGPWIKIAQPACYGQWYFMWWLGDEPPNYDAPDFVARDGTNATYAGRFLNIKCDLRHDQSYLDNVLRPDFHYQWFFHTPSTDGTPKTFRLDRLSVEQHCNMIYANHPVEIEVDMSQRSGITRFANQTEAIAQGYSFPNKRKDTDVSPYPKELSGIKWQNSSGQITVPVWLDSYEDVKPRHKGNRSFVGMVVQMYPPK